MHSWYEKIEAILIVSTYRLILFSSHVEYDTCSFKYAKFEYVSQQRNCCIYGRWQRNIQITNCMSSFMTIAYFWKYLSWFFINVTSVDFSSLILYGNMKYINYHSIMRNDHIAVSPKRLSSMSLENFCNNIQLESFMSTQNIFNYTI